MKIKPLIHNSLRAHARLEGKGDTAKITQWESPEAHISWNFNATQAGAFAVTADVTGAGGGKLSLLIGGKSVSAEVPAATGDRRTVQLGTVVIAAPGECTLELKPAAKNWTGFELRCLTLTLPPAKTSQP